jgi:hypothetical protein
LAASFVLLNLFAKLYDLKHKDWRKPMAYTITQHRRGTYKEWLELDIAPADGELIVVEFDNSLCKCKIGDGETPFSKLPYITDWLAEDFMSRLDTLQSLTGTELAEARAELSKKIGELSVEVTENLTALQTCMESKMADLSSDIEALSSDLDRVDDAVRTLVEPVVGELNTKYSAELSQIIDQQSANFEKLSAMIDAKSAEQTETTEAAINASTAKMKVSLANAETGLTADYTYKIIEAEDRLRTSITLAEQSLNQQSKAIARLQNDLNSLTEGIDDLMDEKVAACEMRINAHLTEVIGELHQTNMTLSELQDKQVTVPSESPTTYSLRSTSSAGNADLSKVVEQLEDLQYKVNILDGAAIGTTAEIKGIKTDLTGLATSVSGLVTAQKANYNALLDALNALEARLAKADSDTNFTVAAHITDITNEITKLNATDTKLYTIMYSIEDKLIKKIDAADALIQAELDDDISRLTQSLTDTTIRLDTQINKAQTDFAGSLAAVSTDLTKKINNLDTVTDSKINATERALATLRASVNATNTDMANELGALTADVLDNKTNITSIRAAISQVTAALDTKTNVLSTNVDNLNTRVDKQLTETEERLTAQVNVVDQHLHNQEQTLFKVQNDVNDLVIDMDNKITEKVLDSQNVVNSNILEIREDIRRINLTLLQLGANNNDGSGGLTGSDLLLLIEQLTALQNKVNSIETKISATSTNSQQLIAELAELKTSLSTLEVSQKATADTLSGALATLESRLSKADADFSAATASTFDKIKAEIADLVADDVLLYQLIYKVREELTKSLNKMQSSVQTDLATKTEAIDKQLSTMQAKLDSDLAVTQDALETSLERIETQATERDKTLEGIIFSKTAENAKTITAIKDTVKESLANTDKEVKTLANDILTNKNNITSNKATIASVGNLLDTKTKSLEASIELLNAELAAQEERLGSITAFDPDTSYDPANGYLADAVVQELVDARLGHTSVANAIVAANNDVRELRNSLSQYIDTKAVDGLHYDYTGEVGLMQPYMLYLKSGNEVIQDSGVQIISGAGGSGGGGGSGTIKINYITPQEVKVTSGAEAKIYFSFSGEDSSGDAIHTASATWRVDGIVVERGSIKSGENYFDATKYIKTGTVKLHLTVTDDNGISATKSWNIQQIELSVDSSFFDKDDYPAGKTILFDFVPTGAVNKVARFILDGEELVVAGKFPMQLDSTKSGTTEYCELPPMAHGAHLLEIYLEADINGTTVQSNTRVVKDIICFDATDKTKPPVIGTATQNLTVKQYSTTNIIYTVYDPNSAAPTVDIKVDDTTVSAGYTVKPNKEYKDTTTAVYTFVATAAGSHEIKIICGATEKVLNIFVEDLGLSIAPVTTGLAFDFNPAGRSNGDANRLWSQGNVHLNVSENFDWTNGGYLPNDPDGPCFCIKAGSSATIDYKLFADEAKTSGKEFKLVFKTKNVANPDAVFLSCLDSKTSPARIGIEMRAQNAQIFGKSGNLELAYSEEDVIEFEFNISKDTDSVPMVMGYEDGVPSRPMIYDSTYSFKQSSPKVITLGSDDCDLYIYRFKVYNTALSNVNILNNYIADARTAEEMVDRYKRNQIYDENNKLTAESLAAKCPWLRIIKVSAPKFTSSKKDDIPNTTIQQIYGQGRASDNWVAYNAVHSGQGTSSDNYGAAGRNLDLKVRVIKDKNDNPINSNPYFLLSDNSVVDKVSLTDKSIPVDYFNIKVNIASSNNLTNAIIANRYNRFNPYKRPYVREDSSLVEYIKDTMEFHNCVVFIQETDPDLSTHREFADTDWHFYAIGNIGDSKKTDNTRVTDPDDPYECCVEIMDVGLPLSAFPRDTMVAGHFIEKKDDGSEVTHITWSKNENLDILYEREYTVATDDKLDFNKTYYIDVDGVKTNAMEYTIEEQRYYTWAKDENLGILYEVSGYEITNDTEVNTNKTYYVDIEGEKLVATEEQLNGINPHEKGLFERTYELTQDTTVDFSKIYFVKFEEKDTDGNVINEVFSDAMGYVFENVKVYKYATQENLDAGLLYEVTYHKTADTEVAAPSVKTYYVDILENDDFSEDYTYGWRYLAKKKDASAVATCKQAWIDFYRFVTTSTDEEFKANLKDYFVVDSALYYYLFTTRYCMVDNRAKNTFWHYGKTADGTRKWDLCWDYDNDTSCGLNNYGKQVYRYGLEDTDYDAAGEEVFRQSNSLFFCRIRDLFDEELKQMYETLESKDAWTASAFINECDEWQSQFPEDLWRIDIERKYIRTYTKSFVNGKGDEQFLRDMANGKMKYHRRQWERNQEQYMASKYQTTTALGDAHHANFRVGRPSGDNLAVQPNYQFTLTPYSHIYLNVKYGGAAPISVRAKPGVPTSVPYSTASADIINVGSAAAISDFGDLSKIYPKTASLQNATRIKKLKLGNSTSGYQNTIFQRLTTGANDLLEELDLTNIVSYTGALDLKELINLKTLLAFGTSLSSVSFADGGKLTDVELPAVNNITLKRLKYLKTDKLKLQGSDNSGYTNVVDLVIEGCPLIDQLSVLEKCTNVQRVRLDNINFGTKTYDYFANEVTGLFRLKGLTATNDETDDAQLTGSVHLETLTGAQFNELTARYPNLTVTYGTLTSTVIFKDTDLTTNIDVPQTVTGIGSCSDPVKDLGKSAPVKDATSEFTYHWFGWSETAGIVVDYNDMSSANAEAAEAADEKKYNEDMLTGIEGDRIFYPVFKAVRNSYPVHFMNPSESGDILLQTVYTPYGKDAVYTASTPIKQDSVHASLYEHFGWEPKPENITGEFTCWAQFAPPDQNKYSSSGETDLDDSDTLPGYTIGWSDLKDYPKYNTSTKQYDYVDGYTLNNNSKTLTITGCSNSFNPILRVPEKLVDNASGNTYTITAIEGFAGGGAFSGNTALKLIYLPDSLTSISVNSFKGCSNLAELTLPVNLASIGTNAFSECTKLSKIAIPASVSFIGEAAFSRSKLSEITVAESNTDYHVETGCLIESNTGKLLQGCADAVIPSYIQSLGTYCFAGISIQSVEIPAGVTAISGNAFNGCTKLTSVTLPGTIHIIDSTSFNGCSALNSIILPEGLVIINTYAFSGCAFSEVNVPSTTEIIRDNAFGNMSKLQTVTFNASADGQIPDIHDKAFANSGPITFNLPWSEEQHYAKFANPTFGAKAGSTLNFNS